MRDQMLGALAKYYKDILMSLSTSIGNHLIDLKLHKGLYADLSFFIDMNTLVERDFFTINLPKIRFTETMFLYKDIENLNDIEEEVTEFEENKETRLIEKQTYHPEQEKHLLGQKLIEIFKKQESDPYNSETLVGFPILVGMLNKKPICAPLFYIKAKVNYNPVDCQYEIKKEFEIPSLNFTLLSNAISSSDEIELIRKQIIPLISNDNFSINTIENVLKHLSSYVSSFNETQYIKRKTPLFEITKFRNRAYPFLIDGIVLIHARKTNTYLLDDITEIIQLNPKSIKETAIETFISEPKEIDNSKEEGIFEEEDIPLFPLLSNPSQKKAALKAEKCKLLVIQGPPGTGKSQTIANLICHLVAKGNTVMITSHQSKALEVVEKLLPKIDYLYMSILKDEKTSLLELVNKIEGFSSYVYNVDLRRYEMLLKNKTARLKEIKEAIKKLEIDFSQVSHIEKKSAKKFYRYSLIKDFDIISENDSLVHTSETNSKILLDKLIEYYGILIKIKDHYSHLSTIYSIGDNQISSEIVKYIDNILKVYELISKYFIHEYQYKELWNKNLRFYRDYEILYSHANGFKEWLSFNLKSLIQILKVLDSLPHEKKSEVHITNTISYIESHKDIFKRITIKIENLEVLVNELLTLEDIPEFLQNPDKQTISHIEAYLGSFIYYSSSWWKWCFSIERRKVVDELISSTKLQITYGNRNTIIHKLKTWINYWKAIGKISEILSFIESLEMPIKLPSLPINPTIADIIRIFEVLKSSISLLQLIKDLSDKDFVSLAGTLFEYYEKGNGTDFSITLEQIQRILELIGKHTKLLLYLEKHRKVLIDFPLYPLILKMAKEIVLSDDDKYFIDKAKGLYPYLKDYLKVKELKNELVELNNTCSVIEKLVLNGSTIPQLSEPDKVLEAHLLSKDIKEIVKQHPEDINEIAFKISELKKLFSNTILEIIDISRKISLKKAESNKGTLFSINKLKTLFRRKRKTASFIQLKQNIDYKEILKVFPCWIMNIDDIPRIFPLEAGLFDYIIIDEASQCSQVALLPLAYRTKRVIFVGDNKQMKNPTTQFLSDSMARFFLSKHKIDIHPKSEFFHGRNSLLDVAIGSQETAPIFLNEHFRCEPSIIEFCNNHFYNGSLKVITPQRKKNFVPCMEIKYIKNAYDDPEDTKINMMEAKAIVGELRRMLRNGELEGDESGKKLTVGILSFYRHQASVIQSLIYEALEDNFRIIKEHEIIISTVDGFQGDERDVIFYSFRYATNSKPGTINVLQREDEHSLGRLNVAFSRARRKVVCFISTPIESFPKGLIRDYLEHVKKVQETGSKNICGLPFEREKCQSEFERTVFDELVKRGYIIYTKVPFAGSYIDMIVTDKEGRRFAIECDGEFHDDGDGLREEDYQRQEMIERAGWAVYRIPSRKFYFNPHKTIEELISKISKCSK